MKKGFLITVILGFLVSIILVIMCFADSNATDIASVLPLACLSKSIFIVGSIGYFFEKYKK